MSDTWSLRKILRIPHTRRLPLLRFELLQDANWYLNSWESVKMEVSQLYIKVYGLDGWLELGNILIT